MSNRCISLLYLLLSSCAAFSDDPSAVATEQFVNLEKDGGNCYWMENYSGDYEWIPARPTWNSGLKISKRVCFKLDSCDGGLGRSGGGCYKWATGPKGERIAWEMQNEYSTY